MKGQYGTSTYIVSGQEIRKSYCRGCKWYVKGNCKIHQWAQCCDKKETRRTRRKKRLSKRHIDLMKRFIAKGKEENKCKDLR